ncbi:hypothetical protein ABPG74_010002 [Tetrahymena malaccensis]
MISNKRNFFKIKVAIFFGYNGKGYHGSQSQKDQNIKTIEKSLFEGLIDSKLISETHMGELKKAGWGRGARTDKGVHALCNGVNVKLAISEDYLMRGSPLRMDDKNLEDIQKEIQEKDEKLLESEQYKKQEGNSYEKQDANGNQASQNEAKSQAIEEEAVATDNDQKEVVEQNQVNEGDEIQEESKKVEDMTEEERSERSKRLQQEVEENRKKKEVSKAHHKQLQEFANERRKHIDIDKIINVLNSNLPGDIRCVSIKQVSRKFDIRTHCKYRVYEYLMPLFMYQKYDDIMAGTPITEEFEQNTLQRVSTLADKFKGTHNYHNYTRQMKAKDPRCMRYILDMKTEIITNPQNGMKFIRFTLVGQSFVYHQIRKMMGMICMMIQEDYPDSFMDSSFFHNVMRIWLAPAHGLFLNRMRFDSYNKKPEIPEPIEFDKIEEDRLREMREMIEKAVMNEEDVNAIYKQWIKDVKAGNELAEENESVSGDMEQ